MTRIIINDASCLIDLLKGRLLHAMLALPFQFVIPHPVRHSELLTLSAQDWQMFDERGVEIYDLEADAVREAFELKALLPRLSANDCFCLVASLRREHAILLTGDAQLRMAAEQRRIEVHGVLWIIDELAERELADYQVLVAALEIWLSDRSVFLPENEIAARLRRLR